MDMCCMDPCSDDQARFELGEDRLYVKSYFAANQGPNIFRLDRNGSHMRSLATLASKVLEDKRYELKALA